MKKTKKKKSFENILNYEELSILKGGSMAVTNKNSFSFKISYFFLFIKVRKHLQVKIYTAESRYVKLSFLEISVKTKFV